MGEVYLAEDVRLGRKVALKFLPASYNTDTDRLRRFEREARAASALNHPHILTIYEVGSFDGRQFIATEFVEGETLRQRQLHSPLKVNEILELALQVTSALSAAHQAGIVHRDIKPENIMLRNDGYAKVVDFGLAKLTETANVSADTSILQVDTGTGARPPARCAHRHLEPGSGAVRIAFRGQPLQRRYAERSDRFYSRARSFTTYHHASAAFRVGLDCAPGIAEGS
jgi:serine/threonine protein kinase